MNQVQLIGRMAREPELRRTEKGTPVVSFALAVDRRFQRDTVDFVDCVAWRGTAEFVNKYFRKGKRVALTGSIQVRKWKDKEGNEIELSSLTEEELQTPNYVSGAALEDAVEPGEMVLDESELEGSFHEATDDELAEAYFGGSHTEDEE